MSSKLELLTKVALVLVVCAIYQLRVDYRTLNKNPALINPESAMFAREVSDETAEHTFKETVPKNHLHAQPPLDNNNDVTTPVENVTVEMALNATEDQSEATPAQNFLPLSSSVFPNATMIQASFDFLQSRHVRYQEAGVGWNWHLRGIAYLYIHQHILLVGQTLQEEDGRRYIRIDNVYNHHQTPTATAPWRDCERLTIWVRVRGPEIFSASAEAIVPDDENLSCYWHFDFSLQRQGDYYIDSKVLLWNAKFAHTDDILCQHIKGNVTDEIRQRYPTHAGFKGFKLYNAKESCCEICSRQQNPTCRYWASPPERMKDPSLMNNGCELFFDANVTVDEIPFRSYLLGRLQNVTLPERQRRLVASLRKQPRRRRLGPLEWFHGFPHNGTKAYFVGCGWNQMFSLDFPCISGALDDKVYMVQESFTFDPPSERTIAPVPLCQELVERNMNQTSGRWIIEPWPNTTECPRKFEFDETERFPLTKHDGEHPHCWNRDDLTVIGHRCAEMNCRFIRKASKWMSDFRQKEWIGVWRPYECDYYEYTDSQLQKCIDAKKIAGLAVDGRSVADSFKQLLNQRFRNLKFYNASDDGKTVTFSTLGLLHKTLRSDSFVRQEFLAMKNRTADDDPWYIVSGFYLTSERETHCYIERMLRFNELVKEVLIPKGYHYLDAFELSVAVAYETAGQFDGMHLMGPPLKVVVTKFFHYLCQDVVDGSRM